MHDLFLVYLERKQCEFVLHTDQWYQPGVTCKQMKFKEEDLFCGLNQ